MTVIVIYLKSSCKVLLRIQQLHLTVKRKYFSQMVQPHARVTNSHMSLQKYEQHV